MNNHVRNKRRYLSLAMVLMLGFSVMMPGKPLRVYAEDPQTVQQEETKDELSAKLLLNTEDNKENYDPHQHAVIDSKDAFTDDDTLSFTEMDGNQINDSVDKTEKETGNADFTVLKGWSLSVAPQKDEKQDHSYHVSLYVDDIDAYKKKETELYHIHEDKVEKLDFAVAEDNSDSDHPEEYLSFQTDSLSSFLFVVKNSVGGGNTGTTETPQPSVTPETTPSPVTTPKPSSEPEKNQVQNEKDIHTAKELKTGDFKLKAGSFKKAPPAPQADDSHIQSFSTELFYGAEKQKDGTYVWNVPETTDEYKAGHRFVFRLNYTFQKNQSVPAGAVRITIPQHILKDRNRNDADTMEWSIPSKQDVQDATDTAGNIDDSKIAKDIDFDYEQQGDNYVITNFRAINDSNTGYIEIAYLTSENSFNYQDMQNMNPFMASLAYTDNGKTETVTADPITTSINTTANLTSVTKRAPYSRTTTWDDKWGNSSDFGIEDPDKYYYLVWDVRSVVNATQPYDISLQDSISSNLGGMIVLGYWFSGDSKYSTVSRKQGSTIRGERWDHVLTAIPLDTYQNQSPWKATNTVSVTVTPDDNKDNSKTLKSSADWSWSTPVFEETGGGFNSYKRGDGAARTGDVFRATTHHAYTRDFKAGNYSRYDLETFNGYDQDRKTTESNLITKTTYDGFDFASWAVGYPYPWTVDGDASNPGSYGQKNVQYILSDEDVFLLNDDSALLSNNGSTSRTIENGSIDGSKAIKLENSDFRIDKLEYSWYMNDAALNQETQRFQPTAATYKDGETLTFRGKFNGSDKWEDFATYNLKTGICSPDSTYVASMDNGTITFQDGQDLTAYQVVTENAHYYTELFTVPFYSLKNSEHVMDLLKNHPTMILLNNNNLKVNADDGSNGWKQIFTRSHSDADYACVSKKSSSLIKKYISTSNNVRQRYFTVTWRVVENETVQSDTGTTSYLPQQSGIFYDLLPDGAQLNRDSIDVRSGSNISKPEDGTKLDPSAYDIRTIANYDNTGRTLLIINIREPGDHFIVTYDTQHSWNSVKDYGSEVVNPVAYETGNESIFNGSPDDGGESMKDPLKDKELLKDVARKSGMSSTSVIGNRFLYAQNTYSFKDITAGSSGLTKKVKMDSDKQYDMTVEAHINNDYSYEIRYMNNFGERSVGNLVFFDSLENYQDSAWHGTLQSVDLSQLKKKGIKPVVYISNVDPVNIEAQHDLTDSAVWTKVDPSDPTDLSDAKAIAVDATKTTDGKDYSLPKEESLVFHLYMKAPSSSPQWTAGNAYPCAKNNVYMQYRLSDSNEDAMMHQDYTAVSLKVAGSVSLHKVSEADQQPIKGIQFRLYGTSAYGNDVDTEKKTDANGNITFDDLEMGNYTLQETDATDDFLLDTTEHSVRIDETGKGSIDGQNCSETPFTITNKPRVHADVTFEKTDSISGKRLTGAEYKLSGIGDYGTDILKTERSYSGTVTFSNIEKGTYTLKEVKAPSSSDEEGQGNYVIDPTEYKVVIDDNGNYRITYRLPVKYSHTSNVSDDGIQHGNYGDYWNNSNITGSDRGDISKAHVVTIPGATSLHITLNFGSDDEGYDDYVSIWQGNHPDYTVDQNNGNAVTTVNDEPLMISGNHTNEGNTREYNIEGDTVTFGFESGSEHYWDEDNTNTDGYGYYAVITASNADEDIEVEKNGDTYRLKDEPLHYVSFEKKSSYDQSALAGAEFSLTGSSDAGTSVNMTAVSQKDTGTVRFNNLEAGSYVLQETKAPDGFAKDSNQYIVSVNSNGEFTIQGLTQDDNHIYQFIDKKAKDGQITVTKIWNDGGDEEAADYHENPNDLDITLSTTVPEAAKRSYQIVYHAEGPGESFPDGKQVNTVYYNALNDVAGGNYKEPVKNNGSQFLGWIDDKGNQFDPQDKESLKQINNGEKNLYAQFAGIKYAVMLYGIGQDTDETGKRMGLTFGPATGGEIYKEGQSWPELYNYNHDFKAHTVDDETTLQYEYQYDHSHHNEITGNDAGTTLLGHAYRCIHYDNWDTIVYWNNKDPEVYRKCIDNGCTHSVELTPGTDAQQTTFKGVNQVVSDINGDGAGSLQKAFGDKPEWNATTGSGMNYATSRVRAMLNGSDVCTTSKNASDYPTEYAGNDVSKYTSKTSILSAFPSVLKNAIGAKKVEYAINNKDYTSDNVIYDKLWLLSNREIYGDLSDWQDFNYEEGSQYERFAKLEDKLNNDALWTYNDNDGLEGIWWTRSLLRDSKIHVSGIAVGGHFGSGFYSSDIDTDYGCITPCFSLSRSDSTNTQETQSKPFHLTENKITDLSESNTPEANETGKEYTYSTSDGKDWVSAGDNVWAKNLDGVGDPDVTLETSKDINGNAVWTYTFNVEDDKQTYYVYEKMKDADNTGLAKGFSSEGSDGKKALELQPGTVDPKTRSYTITNSYNTGTLKITKQVDGTMDDENQEFRFTIQLIDEKFTGILNDTKNFGGVIFKDGIGVVSLKKGESIEISGIPAGVSYAITEDGVSGYSVESKTNDTGYIQPNTEIESVWTNKVETPPTPVNPRETEDWNLQKEVTGSNANTDTAYPFLVSLKNLDANTKYEIDDQDGKEWKTFNSDNQGNADVNLELKNHETVTFKDAPIDSTYQVMEYAGKDYVSSYEITNDNSSGNASIVSASGFNNVKNKEISTATETVDEGEKVTVKFTNDYPSVQSLSIQDWMGKLDNTGKVVHSAENAKDFGITVHFSNIPQGTIIESPEVGSVTPDVYGEADKNITLKADGSTVNFLNIPAEVHYQVTQNALDNKEFLYRPNYSISVHDSAGNTVNDQTVKASDAGGLATSLSTQDETLEKGMNDQVTFVNVPAVNFGIIKHDDKGLNTVSGATYELLHYDGDQKTTSLGDRTTENDGFAGWNAVEDGVYILKEIQAPPGYSVADDIVFKLENGKSTEFCSSKDSLTDAEKVANGNLLQKLTMEDWTATPYTVTEAGSGDTITYQTYPVKEKTSNPLPVTGGRGTRFFLFFGSLLIGFSLIMMRKREKDAVTDSLKM